MEDNSLTFTITKFEGKFAILNNQTFGELKWPIKKMPDLVEVGHTIVLGVLTNLNKSELSDKQLKSLLDELIN
jgi:hypothetical protein